MSGIGLHLATMGFERDFIPSVWDKSAIEKPSLKSLHYNSVNEVAKALIGSKNKESKTRKEASRIQGKAKCFYAVLILSLETGKRNLEIIPSFLVELLGSLEMKKGLLGAVSRSLEMVQGPLGADSGSLEILQSLLGAVLRSLEMVQGRLGAVSRSLEMVQGRLGAVLGSLEIAKNKTCEAPYLLIIKQNKSIVHSISIN